MTIYQHDYLMCPRCGEQSGKRVDHLYTGPFPYKFGPWYCDRCGKAFDGFVNAPGDVAVSPCPAQDKFCRAMALLKLPSTDGDVYFVLNTKRYDHGASYDFTPHESMAYLYEEHSCPTNWVNECVLISQNGDFDPHGFLEFIRHVDVPQNFEEDDDEAIFALFPELATK